MKTLLALSILIAKASIFATCPPGSLCCVKNLLEGETPIHQPYKDFAKIFTLIQERKLEFFIQTAMQHEHSANHECFTLILADWLKKNKGQYYSTYFNEGVSKNGNLNQEDNIHLIELNQGDVIGVLQNFNQKIDFLFLDSMDFDPRKPQLSQQHILKEIEAAYPWLSEQSIVMIDGCQAGNSYKGKLAVDFLLEMGWKILLNDSQIILSQN
jgi:hypothetical protein